MSADHNDPYPAEPCTTYQPPKKQSRRLSPLLRFIFRNAVGGASSAAGAAIIGWLIWLLQR
ncbi:hypothetical protein ACGF5T_31800 [Streptomyces sp. NPDC047853]|uniref:hypothetical protein n=1 Tax=unclassified Streptomyces TaxID=2593676 RepID=UPI003453BDF3